MTQHVYNNIAVNTESCGAIERWCAYNFMNKVGSYKRYNIDYIPTRSPPPKPWITISP